MIDSAFERRATLDAGRDRRLDAPDGGARDRRAWKRGEFRVAEPDGKGGWTVNEWLKKAVLLYFRVNDMQLVEAQPGAVLGQGAGCASRASARPTSASSARAWCRARSCAAARTSARTWC